jgi:predicted CopG family antitoxin
MATKTVALDEEAYALLKRQKKVDESFSDAVKRLARPRKPISSFAGMWSDMSDSERKALGSVYSRQREADRVRDAKLRKMWS